MANPSTPRPAAGKRPDFLPFTPVTANRMIEALHAEKSDLLEFKQLENDSQIDASELHNLKQENKRLIDEVEKCKNDHRAEQLNVFRVKQELDRKCTEIFTLKKDIADFDVKLKLVESHKDRRIKELADALTSLAESNSTNTNDEQINELKSQLGEKLGKVEELTLQNEKLRAQLSERSVLVDEIQARLTEHTEAMTVKLDAKERLINEMQAKLAEQIESFTAQLMMKTDVINSLTVKHTEETDLMTVQMMEKTKMIQDLEKQLNEQTGETSTECKRTSELISQLNQKIELLTTEFEAKNVHIEELNSTVESLRTQLEAKTKCLDEMALQSVAAESQLLDSAKCVQVKSSLIDTLQRKLEEQSVSSALQLNDGNTSLQELKNIIESLAAELSASTTTSADLAHKVDTLMMDLNGKSDMLFEVQARLGLQTERADRLSSALLESLEDIKSLSEDVERVFAHCQSCQLSEAVTDLLSLAAAPPSSELIRLVSALHAPVLGEPTLVPEIPEMPELGDISNLAESASPLRNCWAEYKAACQDLQTLLYNVLAEQQQEEQDRDEGCGELRRTESEERVIAPAGNIELESSLPIPSDLGHYQVKNESLQCSGMTSYMSAHGDQTNDYEASRVPLDTTTSAATTSTLHAALDTTASAATSSTVFVKTEPSNPMSDVLIDTVYTLPRHHSASLNDFAAEFADYLMANGVFYVEDGVPTDPSIFYFLLDRYLLLTEKYLQELNDFKEKEEREMEANYKRDALLRNLSQQLLVTSDVSDADVTDDVEFDARDVPSSTMCEPVDDTLDVSLLEVTHDPLQLTASIMCTPTPRKADVSSRQQTPAPRQSLALRSSMNSSRIPMKNSTPAAAARGTPVQRVLRREPTSTIKKTVTFRSPLLSRAVDNERLKEMQELVEEKQRCVESNMLHVKELESRISQLEAAQVSWSDHRSELEAERLQFVEQMTRLEKELFDIKNKLIVEALNLDPTLESSLHTISPVQIFTILLKTVVARFEKAHLSERMEFEKEREEWSTEMARLSDNNQILANEVSSLNAAFKESEAKYAAFESLKVKKKKLIADNLSLIKDLEIKLASKEVQLSHMDQETDRLTAELRVAQNKIETLTAEKSALEKLTVAANEVESLKLALESCTQEKASLQMQLGSLQDANEMVQRLEEELRICESSVTKSKVELKSLEVVKTDLESQLRQVLDIVNLVITKYFNDQRYIGDDVSSKLKTIERFVERRIRRIEYGRQDCEGKIAEVVFNMDNLKSSLQHKSELAERLQAQVSLLTEQSGEKSELAKQLSSVSEQKVALEAHVKVIEAEVEELREKLSISEKENSLACERLRGDSVQLQAQISLLTDEKSELSKQLSSVSEQNIAFEAHVKVIEAEVEELREKLSVSEKENGQVCEQMCELQKAMSQLEGKMTCYMEEKEQLHEVLRQSEAKIFELEAWKCRMEQTLASASVADDTEMVEKVDALIKEKVRVSVALDAAMQEISVLKEFLEVVNAEKKELDLKIMAVEEENSGLSARIEAIALEKSDLELLLKKQKVETEENVQKLQETFESAVREKIVLDEKIASLVQENVTLKEEIRALTEQSDSIKANYQKILEENAVAQESLVKIIQEKNAILSELNSISQEKIALQAHFDDISREKMQLSSEKSDLESRLVTVTQEKSDLIATIEAITEAKSSLEKKMADISQEKSELSGKVEQLTVEKCDLEVKLSALDRELISKVDAISKLESDFDKPRADMENRMAELVEKANKLEGELKLQVEESSATNASLQATREEMLKLRHAMDTLVEDRDKQAQELAMAQKREESAKDELAKLETEKENLATSLSQAHAENLNFQAELLALKDQLTDNKALISKLCQDLDALAQSRDKLKTEKAGLAEQITSSARDISLLTDERNVLTKDVKQLTEAMALLTTANEALSMEQRSSVTRLAELQLKVSDLEGRNGELKMAVTAGEDEAALLNKRLTAFKETEAVILKKLQEKQASDEAAHRLRDELNQCQDQYQSEITKLQEEVAALQAQLTASSKDIKHEKLASLEEVGQLQVQVADKQQQNLQLKQLLTDVHQSLGLAESSVLNMSHDADRRSYLRLVSDKAAQHETLVVQLNKLTSEKVHFEIQAAELQSFGESQREQIETLTRKLSKLEERMGRRHSRDDGIGARRLEKLEEMNRTLHELLTQLVTTLGMPNAAKLRLISRRDVDNASKTILQHAASLAQTNASLESLQQQVKDLDQENQELSDNVEALLKDNSKLELEILELKKEGGLADATSSGGCRSCHRLQPRLKEKDQQIKDLKEKVNTLDQENEEQSKTIHELIQANSKLETRILQVENSAQDCAACKIAQKNINKLEKELTALQATCLSNTAQISELNTKCAELESSISKKDEQLFRQINSRMRGEGTTSMAAEGERIRSLTKDKEMMKELLRQKSATVKLLEAKTSSCTCKSTEAMNTNRMDSPIRERLYNLRRRTDGPIKRGLRLQADGVENIPV